MEFQNQIYLRGLLSEAHAQLPKGAHGKRGFGTKIAQDCEHASACDCRAKLSLGYLATTGEVNSSK